MKLYLGSYFAFFTPSCEHWVETELLDPAPLATILSELGIPIGEVHFIVLNDKLLESLDVLVSNDDTVRLYPAIGGG